MSEESNLILLGLAESFVLRGLPLRDEIATVFYEAGELEAQGTLHHKYLPTGKEIWEAVIDPTTIWQLD